MILMVTFFAIISLKENEKLAEINREIYEHPFSVTNAVLEANADIISMHRYMKDVVLATTEEELELAISRVEQNEKNVYQHFELINESFLGDREKIQAAYSAFVDWKEIRSEVIALQRNNQQKQAAAITTGKGAEHVTLLISRMNVLIDFARNKALEFKRHSQQAYSESRHYLYVLLFFTIISGLVASVFVIFRVRKAEIAKNETEDKLSKMAHFDTLTGLPNRVLFIDRFRRAMASTKRTGSQLAICFLDLDYFKPINDGFGHDIGDQILIQVAQRIKSMIREEDTVSRQGGDEFALLLSNIESVSQYHQRLDRILHAISQDYIIGENTHHISASIGLTLYPFDDSDLDTLLRHADMAMYEAKVAGRNQHRLFSIEQEKQAFDKSHRLGEIKQALANNELSLYYQPKVNMVTGDVFGAEALIRWHHPQKGLVPPMEFLPVIHGNRLELSIGEWVINQALSQIDIWQQNSIKLEVSINISSNHLLSRNFIPQLEKAFKKYPRVEQTSLQLEILESGELGDVQAVSKVIKLCRSSIGVNFALDDFGTGYSSLSHLRNLPINTLKIDQSFIKNMLIDSDDAAIVEGVIGLADAFHREVIAEGVETVEHGLILIKMGCQAAQGYGIAKPMPAGDIAGWLSHYTPNQDWLSKPD